MDDSINKHLVKRTVDPLGYGELDDYTAES
jgi:hypothetical protein